MHRANGDAGEGGVPGEHVPVHGDHGRGVLVAEPRGAGEVD